MDDEAISVIGEGNSFHLQTGHQYSSASLIRSHDCLCKIQFLSVQIKEYLCIHVHMCTLVPARCRPVWRIDMQIVLLIFKVKFSWHFCSSLWRLIILCINAARHKTITNNYEVATAMPGNIDRFLKHLLYCAKKTTENRSSFFGKKRVNCRTTLDLVTFFVKQDLKRAF